MDSYAIDHLFQNFVFSANYSNVPIFLQNDSKLLIQVLYVSFYPFCNIR